MIDNTETIKTEDYQQIQRFLSGQCGIVITDNKHYLVKNRLLPLFTRFNLDNFTELANALQSSSSATTDLKNAVVEAMTTNETYWFRDTSQFVELKTKVLPELFNQHLGVVKIWSAACSSGQEPYSISISVTETLNQSAKQQPVQIIATDISEAMLQEARVARYSEMALSRGISPADSQRYFKQQADGYWLNTEISQRVQFQAFNLLDSFAPLGRFHIIFCRNVLIYFSEQVKRDILSRMANSLEIGGYLFLSSTEAMPLDIAGFETVRSNTAFYFKKIAV